MRTAAAWSTANLMAMIETRRRAVLFVPSEWQDLLVKDNQLMMSLKFISERHPLASDKRAVGRECSNHTSVVINAHEAMEDIWGGIEEGDST